MNLALFGRVLLSVPFLMFGVFHFMNAEQMAAMAPFGGVFIIYLTGLCNLAAAASFLSGKQMRLAGLLAALLMVTYVALIHVPGFMSATDPGMQMMSMAGILKDLGLAGGALLLAQYASTKQ